MLLNVDHVDAIYSTFSGTSRAASPVAKSSGKVFVYAAAAISPATDNPIAFKSYLDYERGCCGIAETWKRSGVSSVGVLKADSEFGELSERGILSVYPNASSISYKLGEDVATPALRFKTQGIEAVANAGLEGDMVNMLKAFQRIEYAPRVGANEDIFTEKVRKEFADLMPKVRVFGMPRPDESFIKEVLARDTKKEVQSFDSAGMAYLHIRQMYAAVSKCGTVQTECQAQALKNAVPDSKLGFEKWSADRRAIYRDTQYDLVKP
jgi:ABC-type branched-subunit amino acid transport system substrate-binding protein